MGGRYLVTGVQLVMLKTVDDKGRKKLCHKIVENQFLFDSENEISVDVEAMSRDANSRE